MNMRIWLQKGFTLIEVLAVVAVISVVASAGYYTATSVRESARESKLESDVASLNSAVQIYEAAGGNFTDLPDGDGDDTRLEAKILNKLKVRADSDAMSKFNGITGSMVDARLKAGDYVDKGKRAYWEAGARRFLLAEGEGGRQGVEEFTLSEDAVDASRELGPTGAPYIRADRALDASNLKEGPKWVWEHSGATVLAKNEVANPDPVVPAPTAFPVPDASVAPPPVATATPFVPTPPPTPTPTPNPGGGGGEAGGPSGALVESATLYGSSQFVGNLQIAVPASGNMANIFSYSDTVIKGNLYLPGTPEIYINWQGNRWTQANDVNFSNYIKGRQYNESGKLLVSGDPGYDPNWNPSPRVVDLQGSVQPDNYYLMFYGGSVDGKVYRRSSTSSFKPIVTPPEKNNSVSRSYDGYNTPPSTISAKSISGVALNSANLSTRLIGYSGALGDWKKGDEGVFGRVDVNSNGILYLGDPNNPDVTQYYSFDRLQLNDNSKIVVLGKAEVTIKDFMQINSQVTVGSEATTGLLTVNFMNGFQATTNTQFFGKINAPTGEVIFDGASVFRGSVAARSLQIRSQGVVFTLPPVTTGN